MKGMTANILGFAGHTVYCHNYSTWTVKSSQNNESTNEWGYVPINLYLEKQLTGS